MNFSAKLDEQFRRELEAEARRRRWTWRVRYLKGPVLAIAFLAVLAAVSGLREDPKLRADGFAHVLAIGVLLVPLSIHALLFLPRLFRLYRTMIFGFAVGCPPRAIAAVILETINAGSLRFLSPIARAFRYFFGELISDHEGIGIHASMLELRTLFRIPWRSRAFDAWLARQPRPVDFDSFLAHCQCTLDTICGPFKPELPAPPDLSRPIPIQSDTSPILALVPLAQIAGMKIDDLGEHPRWAPMLGADELHFDLTRLNRRNTLEMVEKISDIHMRILGVSRPPYTLTKGRRRRVDEALAAAGLPGDDWPTRISCRIHRGGEWIDYAPISDAGLMQFVNAFLFFFYRVPWRWEPFESDYKLQTADGRVVPVRITFEPNTELKIARK
ncbi:MAG: hypothetical protein ABFD69_16815 [Candidatus Sumerlaeia bacterium]